METKLDIFLASSFASSSWSKKLKMLLEQWLKELTNEVVKSQNVGSKGTEKNPAINDHIIDE